jgi:molybdopterin biosynthesis enzyme
MTRAVTIRLDDADHAALAKQADELRIRPGTLARMLVHAGLSGNAPAVVGVENARAALDRLVSRSQKRASADAVRLVADARVGLEPQE